MRHTSRLYALSICLLMTLGALPARAAEQGQGFARPAFGAGPVVRALRFGRPGGYTGAYGSYPSFPLGVGRDPYGIGLPGLRSGAYGIGGSGYYPGSLAGGFGGFGGLGFPLPFGDFGPWREPGFRPVPVRSEPPGIPVAAGIAPSPVLPPAVYVIEGRRRPTSSRRSHLGTPSSGVRVIGLAVAADGRVGAISARP